VWVNLIALLRSDRASKIYRFRGLVSSSVDSPNALFLSNILTLSEQQYFVWDSAPHSTKQQDMLKISGGIEASTFPGYLGVGELCWLGQELESGQTEAEQIFFDI